MIAKSQDDALLIPGNEAAKNPDWADYANFCFMRQKGLRKQALKHLDDFLAKTKNWQLEEKKTFLSFLFTIFESMSDADTVGCPEPLSKRLVKPALEEWCGTENKNSEPFRWYGAKYHEEEYLHKALEINPADDLARVWLIKWNVDGLYFATHHLPEGFIGDPYEELQFGEKALDEIKLLSDPKLRDYWTDEAEWYLDMIRNYSEWKKSGHPCFEEWGKETGKNVDSGIIRVYYTE